MMMRRPPVLFSLLLVVAGCGGGDGSTTVSTVEYRAIDGSGNNIDNPGWGRANAVLLRIAGSDYSDGVSEPSGADRPGPREVSNACCWQDAESPNVAGASNFLWQWGQFIDHDITLSGTGVPSVPFDIPVPMGDPMFDPMFTGEMVIPMERSIVHPATGTATDNPLNQMNELTAYIDASNVYGSDAARAHALRANDGRGRMKTSDGDLLPFNTEGLPNAEAAPTLDSPDPSMFVGGDIRANEQVGLTAMHTLFVREHNRLAAEIRAANPDIGGEEIYQRARALVGAELQVITYKEFLPLLLGADWIEPYGGYDPGVNAGIDATFSTASYRLGHTLLSPFLARIGADGETIAEGDLALREAFFDPSRLIDEGGIEPLLRGLAMRPAQELDLAVVDDVRNFLFGPPGAGGFDLVSLNIQRGRDHGLMSYNATREAFGLPAAESFADISSDPDIVARLMAAYESVELVDPWVGGLAEDHLPGGMTGELLRAVVGDQFTRLRDGDRFWYQRVFSGDQLRELEETTLAAVIRRNTTITTELSDTVFLVP